MKTICCTTIIVLVFCAAGPAAGQDEVAEGRAMVQAARDEIIRSELNFSDDEMAAFWPVYQEYTARRTVLMDRYTDLISEYMRRYDNADVSDEYADKLITDFFEIKRARLDLGESYVAKFKEVLPVLKVAQFYQLEHKIDADIDSQLAISVPLIE